MCGTCEYDLTRQKGPRRCEEVKGPGWTQCHQQGSLLPLLMSDVWPCPQGTGHPQKLESARKVLSWTSHKDAMLPKRRLYSPETHSELVV